MPLKAREIEERFKNMGSERATIHCLTEIAEYQRAQREQIMQLATMYSNMINILEQFTVVAENMKSAVQKLEHKEHEDDKD